MNDVHQQINGNNNTQVAGDYISTNKIVHKTEVLHDPDLHVTDEQAKTLRDKVYKITEARFGEKRFNKPPYGVVYNSLYDRYKITSYKLLPREKFDDAIKWLDKQIAIYRPKLRNIDVDQYRKDMYKAINARANQLGINVHEFATQALELKDPVVSLKSLSNNRLKDLHKKLFSKRTTK